MKVLDLYQNSITNKISKWFGAVYSDSLLAGFARKFGVIYRGSFPNRIFAVHNGELPKYTGSVAFGILKRTGGWVNSAAGRIHDYFAKYFSMSLIGKTTGIFRDEARSCGLVLAFIASGYAIGITALSKWSVYSLALVIVLAIASVIVFFTAGKWRGWFEASMFCKLVYFLFEK